MTSQRIVDPSNTQEDPALRPKNLDEYIGQKKVVDNLKIYIRAAKARGESMDHVLLLGPLAWVKHHLLILLLRNWVLIYVLLRVP